MATIDDRATIDRIIAANGKQYEDEPPVVRIVEYTNAWGKTAWGVIWDGEDILRYHNSPAVDDPKIIFDRTNTDDWRVDSPIGGDADNDELPLDIEEIDRSSDVHRITYHDKQRTPYAVLCPEHGQVFLSVDEYDVQLEAMNSPWHCPCGRFAQFDDENYEDSCPFCRILAPKELRDEIGEFCDSLRLDVGGRPADE